MEKQKQRKPKQNQRTQRSPNLLFPSVLPKNKLDIIAKHHLTIVGTAKLIIIFIQTVFVFSLGLNSKSIADISSLEQEVLAYQEQILQKHEEQAQLEKTIIKIEKLKALEREQKLIGSKLKQLISSIPENITLIRSKTDGNSLDLTVETKSPLDASLLMSLYLEKQTTKEIILKSAKLNQMQNTYETNLEVRFNQND